MAITPALQRFVARQFGGAKLAEAIDEGIFGTGLGLKKVSASTTGITGKILVVDATTANVVVTAPAPASGGVFGLKLVKTASSHTLAVAAHAAETFDGTTPPAASSTVGALQIWQSDGTNWVLVAKI